MTQCTNNLNKEYTIFFYTIISLNKNAPAWTWQLWMKYCCKACEFLICRAMNENYVYKRESFSRVREGWNKNICCLKGKLYISWFTKSISVYVFPEEDIKLAYIAHVKTPLREFRLSDTLQEHFRYWDTLINTYHAVFYHKLWSQAFIFKVKSHIFFTNYFEYFFITDETLHTWICVKNINFYKMHVLYTICIL